MLGNQLGVLALSSPTRGATKGFFVVRRVLAAPGTLHARRSTRINKRGEIRPAALAYRKT